MSGIRINDTSQVFTCGVNYPNDLFVADDQL